MGGLFSMGPLLPLRGAFARGLKRTGARKSKAKSPHLLRQGPHDPSCHQQERLDAHCSPSQRRDRLLLRRGYLPHLERRTDQACLYRRSRARRTQSQPHSRQSLKGLSAISGPRKERHPPSDNDRPVWTHRWRALLGWYQRAAADGQEWLRGDLLEVRRPMPMDEVGPQSCQRQSMRASIRHRWRSLVARVLLAAGKRSPIVGSES